ncbi:MAG: hypothetical protein WCO89_11530, partial [Syntrophus sp. (in: bacteria)]
MKNTTALTQTGVLTADTLNLTNTAGATNLSSQDNVITKLGTINATGQTFSLKNTTNLTQAVESAITADGISLSGTGSYTLTNTGNTINKFASDATGTINFYNNMCMAVDTVGSVTGITLVNNSVTLTAGGSNGNLTISQAIGKSTGSADANLTLNANNNININANISSTAGKLNLTLNADSDGMGGGTSTIASNKTVNANYGNLTYNKGLTVNGTLKNSTLISGDGTTLSGAASFDNMTIGSNLTKSGNLDIYNNLTLADGITLNTTGSFPTIRFKTYGPQTVSTAGSATWAMANGTIYAGYNYAQTLTLGAGLTLSGYGSLTKMFNSTEIINNGAILANTTGQSWSISPTIFSNAGTVQSTFGNISISPLTFNNTGSLLVGSGSTMSAAPGDPFTNTGTIDVANGATFSKTTGFTNTGTLTGAGTITVGTGSSKLVNQGNINPGGTGTTGTLAITGDVQLDTGSNLNIELGGTAAGEYDVLAVSGTATLGGALNVSEVNGFLTRKDNNFTVLTAGSRSGDFSTSSYPTDVSFSATPTGNLTLTANSTTTRWNSDYDGDWTNSSYWSRGVPTSTDNVVISRPYSNPTISILSGSQAANEFTCDETLSITGGSLSLGGASTVKYLTLSGGSLGGSGTLAVTGSGTWSGGSLGGALQVDSGATLLINGSGAKSFNG